MLGAVAYGFRAWNLWGNTRAPVLFAEPGWLWSLSYATSAAVLVAAAALARSRRWATRAVWWATSTVITMSAARAFAVSGHPTGGIDSLHVAANFAFLAAVVATTWPHLVHPEDHTERTER